MKLPFDLRIIFLFPLFLTLTPVSSQFHFHNNYCIDAGNYTKGSTYDENLIGLFPNLVKKASLSNFNNQTLGQGIDQIYGIYMCRGDLNEQQCHDCVELASETIVEKCPVEKEAIVWYEECMVRYANRPIFSHQEDSQMSYTWSIGKGGSVTDPVEFGKVISETVDGLIEQAAYNTSRGGYATDQAKLTLFTDVYAFAQCTPDILGIPCERCLRVAFRSMGACCGTDRVFLGMYFPSCWLRYAQEPFIGELGSGNDTETTPAPAASTSESGPPTLNFDLPIPNNTPDLLPPPPPSAGNQLTSLKNYLIVMTSMTVFWLCMSW